MMLDATLPKGAFWSVKADGDFDKLLDGIGDNIDIVREFLARLARIRDPQTVDLEMLPDLEREYGVLTDLAISVAQRRNYLAGVKYALPGTGSEDDVELALRNAGFDVRVIQNSPRVDPNSILNASFLMWAGGETGFAGYHTVASPPPYASVAGKGGGDLLVNGLMDGQVSVYTLPVDDHRWNFVFWVGKDFTGASTFIDWDMERSYTGAWTPGGGAVLTKVRAPREDVPGLRSMSVLEPTGAAIENVEPAQPDASLIVAYQMADNAGTLESIAWANQLADGSMEATGTAAYAAAGGATLSKQTTDPISGSQYLRATCTAGICYAQQIILTVARTYRVTGWGRGNTSALAGIDDGVSGYFWTSDGTASWQYFDFTFVAAGTTLRLATIGASPDYAEFDSVHVAELTNVADQDMETAGVASWGGLGLTVFQKLQDSPKQGLRYMRATYNGTANPGVFQGTTLVIGNRHHVRGWFRSDGTSIPQVKLGTTTYQGTTSTAWQRVDQIMTVAGNTTFTLDSILAGAGHVDFDGFDISPALDITGTNTVPATDTITQHGQALDFDGTNDYTDLGTDTRFNIDRRFTVHVVFRVDAIGAGDQYIYSRRNALAESYNLYFDATGDLRFYMGSGVSLSTGHTVEAGKTYDVVFSVNTNANGYKIYVNGVAPAGSVAFTAFTLAAGESLQLGAKSGPANYADVTISAFEFYDEQKSDAQAAALYQITRDAMLAGAYAEQIMADPATESRPLAGWAQGDGDGGIPCVLYLDSTTGLWEFAWIGDDTASDQTISATLANGCGGIRLYTKFDPTATDRVVTSYFDNVTIQNLVIEPAQIPNEQRAKFEKIILQTKPLRSWAGIVADYV
jgi:hypothetical protein